MKWFLAVFAVLMLVPNTVAAPLQGYADLVESVQDAVVNIQVTQDVSASPQGQPADPFEFFFRQGRPGRPRAQQTAGTGFIMTADGYVVTNRHVVRDSSKITVTLHSGKTVPAKLIGTDDSMDVAVIKIDQQGLPTLKIGDSEKIRIGDEVLALGYPLQLGFTVTRGIVSGIGRDLRNDNFDIATYLQTDADITFGNSGGPLINTAGEVIAINTMIVQNGETYGFSIPSHLFMNSVDQLRQSGKVKRGALGISVGDLDEESKDYYKLEQGAMVVRVTEGMAAAKAGVKDGDIILAINGKAVKGSSDVIATISSLSPNTKVSLKLLSNGKEVTKTVTLGNREDVVGRSPDANPQVPDEAATVASGLGFSVAALDDELRTRLDVKPSVKAVIVDEVDEESIAYAKGVRPGTLILRVGQTATPTPDALKSATAKLKKDEVVPVLLMERTRSESGGITLEERTVFLRKN